MSRMVSILLAVAALGLGGAAARALETLVAVTNQP